MEKWFFVFLAEACYSYYGCRFITVNAIKAIGTNTCYYPKQYVSPKRWMKKHYGINERVIPRFLFFNMYLALLVLILGFITCVICIAVNGNYTICKILFEIQVYLMFIFVIYEAVMENKYKKGIRK